MAQALPLLPDALMVHWEGPEELAVLLFVKDLSLGWGVVAWRKCIPEMNSERCLGTGKMETGEGHLQVVVC